MPSTEHRLLAPLTHPVFLLALVALVANDRVGKVWFPGPVTGKLSDLAGPIVLATLVGVAVRRVRPGAAVAVALAVPSAVMVVAKSSAFGADLIATALDLVTPWSNRIVADPWDLFGLVGLAVMPRILATGVVANESAADTATTQAPVRSASVLRWTVLVVGVWACTATSAEPPSVYDRVGVTEAGVVAIDPDQNDSVLSAPDPNGPWITEVPSPTDELLAVSRSTEICLERTAGVCIRTGPSLRIDESADGGASWRTVWELDPEESWIGQTRSDAAALGADQLRAGEVLELDDGRVMVAMGVFEPVTRGVDGVWGPEPSGFRDSPDAAWLFLAPTVFGLILSLTLVWPSATHVRTRVLGLVSLVLGIPAIAGSMYAWLFSPYDGFTLFPFFFLVLGTTMLQLLVVLIGWGFRIADADRRLLVVVVLVGTIVATVLVLILTVVPLEVWQSGAIGWTSARTGVFAAALLGSVAASVGLGLALSPAVVEPQEL